MEVKLENALTAVSRVNYNFYHEIEQTEFKLCLRRRRRCEDFIAVLIYSRT